MRGGNPKTACGEAAEKNGSREKKTEQDEEKNWRKKEELLPELVGARQDVRIKFQVQMGRGKHREREREWKRVG